MRDLMKWIYVVLSCLSLATVMLLGACNQAKESDEAVVKEGTPIHSADTSEGGKVAGGATK